MPILIFIARTLLGAAIFTAADAVIESLLEKDEDTLLDEILATGLAGVGITATAKIKLRSKIKSIPIPAGINTPLDAAKYLEDLTKNKVGLRQLNARLGGYAPLAIKFTKVVAAIFTKKGLILTGAVLILYKVISWLIWMPQLLQQTGDPGTFAPEQANAVLESWGMPWRFPISETRRIQTELERLKLETLIAGSKPKTPRTIIRMVEQKEPEQFIGTLFSAKLGDMKSFSRAVDDEITSEEDLREDVKLNLNRWLATLPGRLGYSVVIRKDPVDHTGVKQSGMWATLTTHFTRLTGAIQPIDTILLGPVSSMTRLKISKTIKTIESDIPKMFTGQEVLQVEVPGGTVDIFDTAGERVDLSTPRIPISKSSVLASKSPLINKPSEKQDAVLPVEISKTPEPAVVSSPFIPPVQTPEQRATAKKAAAELDIKLPDKSTTTKGKFIQELGIFIGEKYRVDTGGDNLNSRGGGGLNAPILRKIPDKTIVKVIGDYGPQDGFYWVDVEVPGIVGSNYVAGDFLIAL